ncbi:MAG: ribonuclease III [Candidatus Zixiibacteriota bacterium]|nr:MAG: ribonuclease III [candidate division Zixibacteria bacterium]
MKFFDSLKRTLLRKGLPAEKRRVGQFHHKFGYRFKNGGLLIQALTHRSYVYHSDSDIVSNERLEFLGDSILGLVIAEYLYDEHPDYNEGDLTKTKAILVNETTLSQVGLESGLNEFILMSPEEGKSGGRERSSIISDAVEAVIGAIYLDSGLNAVRDFIKHMIISRSLDIMSDANQRNYKGELLEYLQSKGEGPPFYEVVSESGPDHDKTFTVIVKTAGLVTGTGRGPSKKEAEQHAASEALRDLIERAKKKKDR